MKSAYEIAMARLEKEHGPSKALTDEQKTRIADIENRYDAKVAELRIAMETKLHAATSLDEQEAFSTELTAGLARLEEQREKEKEAVRHG